MEQRPRCTTTNGGDCHDKEQRLRFITSIILLVSSVVVLVLGIGQQTWLKPEPTVTQQLSLSGEAPAVVVSGGILASHPGPVTVTVDAPGAIAAGVAIESDVTSWLGDGKADTFTTDSRQAQPVGTLLGTSVDVPSVAGSDLWTEQFSGTDHLEFTLTGASAEGLIISGGSGVVPASVSLSWAQDTSTPLALPLFIIGGFALIAGVSMLAFAIRHERRVISPRRQSRRGGTPGRSRMPVKRGKGRRAASMTAAILSGLALVSVTGCTAGSASSSSASYSAGVNPVVSADAPRLTSDQLQRIISDVSQVAATADANRDVDLAKTRFTAAALQLREKNYAARAADGSVAAPIAIPNVAPTVFLPQLSAEFPRQAFVILDDPDSTDPAVALSLVQNSARENYHVASISTLFPKVEFPALPTAGAGGVALAPDSTLLSVAPSALGGAYADLIANGANSKDASLFASTTDPFIDATQAHVAQVTSQLGSQGTVTFSRTSDTSTPPLSFATADSGAIVAVFVLDKETSTPNAGFELSLTGEAKALLGKASTSKGVVTTYGDMLLFSVPAAGSSSSGITLLGFSSGIVNVEEVQ